MKVLLGQFEFFNEVEAPRTRKCKGCKETFDIKKFYGDVYKGYSSYCIPCHTKQTQSDIKKRISTKKGFLDYVYKRLVSKRNSKKIKELPEKEQEKYNVDLTFEEFVEMWEAHEKKYGFHCMLSGQKIVFIKSENGVGGPGGSYSNTMSPDRLDPNRCYTKQNLIFVANEVNLRKKDVTFKDCLKIVEIYKERYPEEFK